MSTEKQNQKYLSQLGAWAFAIGTSVGWGSLVVTSSSYLAQAGPLGSVLGLAVGTVIMFIMGRNYAYMMKCYPENGGIYVYAREVFGYDQGFLGSWFAIMTYLAILWANVTSLPLFGRIFLGSLFSFGKLYTIFGYDVYFGEVLLSISALVLFSYICTRRKKVLGRIMIAFAVIFFASVSIVFIGSLFHQGTSIEPVFLPDVSALKQIMSIAVITPWAFIGFESISHQTEEMNFGAGKYRKLLTVSVVTTALLYIMIILLSVKVFPPQYSSWLAYIQDLDHLSGIEALPTFYSAYRMFGNAGVFMFMMALLALVMSSVIGNITALSRLVASLGKDQVIPSKYAFTNQENVPANAIWFICGVSCLVPFVGRTAIGWIVDVTTIGAVLVYGFVSACTMTLAKDMGEKKEMWFGRIGLLLCVILGGWYLLPNLISKGTIARETYLLFIVWSAIGFVAFRIILQRDRKKRFGQSFSVWISMLTLVLMISLIWMRQSMITSFDATIDSINTYFLSPSSGLDRLNDAAAVIRIMEGLENENVRTMMITIAMFGFALVIMLTNHSYMNRRQQESETAANRDPMTGVMSKHAYLVREKEMDAELQSGGVRDFAVVVCDVNGLKKINDTLGHKAGDEYIRKACTMICDIFQHSPVFRVGGDEFVAILTGRDYVIRTDLMAELHERSCRNIEAKGAVVSGGLSEYDASKDTSIHEIFERADAAMYEEKMRLKGLGASVREDEKETAPQPLPELEEEIPIVNVRKHIVIAEDELINQEILGNVLENDYDILYASNGEETLKILREHKDEIALLLLDLQMPVMDGMEVLSTMKSDSEISSIPVIVMTSDQTAELECLKLGAMDFIPKPYPMWEIVKARVSKAVELSENRDLIQHTQRDSLTDLFNVDYFFRYVSRFDQTYWDMPMDAIVLDVNHFHMINERYGRHYGDTVLRRIGESVRKLARKIGGIGCRRSGDTFLIYCPHREDYQEMLDRISADIVTDEASANRVRLRFGVYSDVDKKIDVDRRFDRAKIASDNVRNNYAVNVGIYDDEMGEKAMFREKLLEDFPSSIENNRFRVFFQPKFNIRPNTPVLESAEALVRWDHPELGMISPAVFIPLLEENGMILELDKFVWNETASQIRRWKDTFGYSVPVSVNVSRVDMLNPNLKSIFMDIVKKNGITSNDIILEITESAYTGDSEQVISTARELRGMGMGFRIEMDDFGTGYSSLGMLTHLPIDALKLDMTFVRSAFGETRDVRMIELIIDIADYLHVPVVAEGVETEEQYLVLKAMGCDLVQGYYFSKPVPAEEFEKFLKERKEIHTEVTPEVRKTFMSISKALNSDFERIYYVDMITDHYLGFRFSQDRGLEIMPGGPDFYTEFEKSVIETAAEADRERMKKDVSREGLQKWLHEEELTIPYHKMDGTEMVLQSIRRRSTDDHHIVIGIRPKETEA